MILHIIDDSKFALSAYNLFSQMSVKSEWIVPSRKKELTFLKSKKVKKLSPWLLLSKKFARSFIKYECVVIHYLDYKKIYLIKNLPLGIPIVWIGWGGDYYDNYLLENPDTLLLDKTLNLKKEILKTKEGRLNFFRNKFIHFLWSIISDSEYALERINYFAPILESEYVCMKKRYPNFLAKYIDWNYGNFAFQMENLKNVQNKGNNILVGNSATYENNHLEIIEKLKKLELSKQTIFLPLSYGDSEYKFFLIKYLDKIDTNICIIQDFVPLEEYINLISSCSIVIMNHLRQQGLGNILIMLFLGSKVFLNPLNPLYDFFKGLGIIIYSVEDISEKNLTSALNIVDMRKNRNILKEHFSKKVLIEKTEKLIETVCSKHDFKK